MNGIKTVGYTEARLSLSCSLQRVGQQHSLSSALVNDTGRNNKFLQFLRIECYCLVSIVRLSLLWHYCCTLTNWRLTFLFGNIVICLSFMSSYHYTSRTLRCSLMATNKACGAQSVLSCAEGVEIYRNNGGKKISAVIINK